MKKIHFAIMMLLMSIALMTEAQTNKELPKSLFYVNPKAKPFIERVYAKFPKQSGFSVSKSISHYYTAFAGNPELMATLSESELNEWKEMLNSIPAKKRSMNENKNDSNGVSTYDCEIELNSNHKYDKLEFYYKSSGLLEMKYLCLDDMSVIDRGGIKLKESEWRKVDNMVQEFVTNRKTDAYNYLVWNEKKSNINSSFNEKYDNATMGRYYVVHNCDTKDYDRFIDVLNEIVQNQESFVYMISPYYNNGGPIAPMVVVDVMRDDNHNVAFIATLQGTDLYLAMLGGTVNSYIELPYMWAESCWTIGKVDLKKENKSERVYDPSTVSTLPKWRISVQPEWNGYLGQFGLRNCKYNEDTCVAVMFTVLKDGTIVAPKVVLDNTNINGLAEQAVKVISQMPRWTPATVDGLPVDCRMVVRITK
jgi:hypothetical protein